MVRKLFHIAALPWSGADPFGFPTIHRPWDDGSDSVENAKRRLRAAFEFFQKLGVQLLSQERIAHSA